MSLGIYFISKLQKKNIMLKLCDTLDFMLYDSSHHIYCTLPPWDDPARNLFSRHNLWCWGLIREKRKSRYVYSLPAHILSPPTPQHIDQLTRKIFLFTAPEISMTKERCFRTREFLLFNSLLIHFPGDSFDG